MTKLLVATGNMGKLKEYQELLSDLDVEWVSLKDVGLGDMDVDETGSTFTENAILKAESYSQAANLITLADDSGLVVDALDGRPGIYSARYGAPAAKTDQDRYQKLLGELDGIAVAQRTARFVCVVAIAIPNHVTHTVEGLFEGHIATAPLGEHGFGYDPIFELPDGRTLAQLPPAEKHRISHRGLALEKARPYLLDVLSDQ